MRRPNPRQLKLFPGFLLPATEAAPPPRERLSPASASPVVVVPAARERITRAAAGEAFRNLGQILGGRLEHLTLTANRSTLLSVRRVEGGRFRVRAHWSVTLASPELLEDLALLATREGPAGRRAAAREAVRSFIARHQPPFAVGGGVESPGRVAPLRPGGRHHDLSEILGELNQQFFQPPLEVEITWGRSAGQRRRRRGTPRTLRLGSYDSRQRRIRIHPSLDRASVPRYVVTSIVHHEMLHAVIPPEVRPGKRRRVHPPELRRRERELPDFERAEQWLRRNLGRLLRC